MLNAKYLIFNADKEPNNLKFEIRPERSALGVKNSTLPTYGIDEFVKWYREFYR